MRQECVSDLRDGVDCANVAGHQRSVFCNWPTSCNYSCHLLLRCWPSLHRFHRPESWGPPVCSKKAASMELTLEIPIGTAVCETCTERGRPHEPAYKMGMCEFCYKGKPHPRATREQLAKERACARPERSTAFLGR